MIYICWGSANIPNVQKSLLKSEHIFVQPAAPGNNGILTLWFSTERSWQDHLLIKTPVKVKSVEEKFTGASTLNDILILDSKLYLLWKYWTTFFFKIEHSSCEHISLLNATTYPFSVLQAQGWGEGFPKILAYKGRLHPKEVPFSGLRYNYELVAIKRDAVL